ncbi:MAG: lipopolysaccharide biosynthesis protein [Clostridia bacterium]
MNKKNVVSNMLWRFADRCGAQGISFVVSIILARILTTDEYGTIALVTVFIAILQVFVNGGFSNALIQKKDADIVDFSTVFFFNIFSCTLIYFLLFLAAPFIADFYNQEILTNVIRVLGLKIIISGLLSVQTAYVTRNMMFKKYFYSNLSGSFFSGVVGVAMVYNGFGVWSLVGQALSEVAINTVVLWYTIKFRPKMTFSLERLKGLFSFGWKVLVSNLMNTLYSNLKSLLIGKMYSTTDLAFYNKADQFPRLIITNLNVSIDSVLFSSMSKAQDNIAKVKAMARTSVKTSSYIVWPCMIGLFVCAEPLVELLLTEQWLPCVPYLRIFCITYGFLPVQTANLNAIKAIGRGDIFLKLQTIGKTIGLISILITMFIGVYAIAIAGIVVAIIEVFIKATPNKKLIGYGYVEQMKDILPSMALSAFMGICIWWIQYLNLSLILILVLQMFAGAVVYILVSMLFKMESFNTILQILKGFKNKLTRKQA